MTPPGGRRLELAEAARLVRPRDTVLSGFAAGQPVGLLDALGARPDLDELVIYTGLLIRPFAMLEHPGIRVVSGFFGPIERALSDTRVEVRRTATPEFHDRLADEERELAGLLTRLRALAAA